MTTTKDKSRTSLACLQEEITKDLTNPFIFVIFGASGDLAKKKIFPSLWNLKKQNLLPKFFEIVGFARSNLGRKELCSKVFPYLKAAKSESDKVLEFCKCISYFRGQYDEKECYKRLYEEHLKDYFKNEKSEIIIYLALPPTLYFTVTQLIREECKNQNTKNIRVIIEKPFGRDAETSEQLSQHLQKLFIEKEIYRIDHYLGKEMVQNLMVIRFANLMFMNAWNNSTISSVVITFKEPFGTEGRGGYFDQFGIIRDVMQNHLMQIVSLVAMDEPQSNSADDIRKAKVEVLEKISSPSLDDVIIGQYIGNKESEVDDEKLSYVDDPGISNDSLTSTYACVKLMIDNDKWKGVPFFLKCGKALNEKKAEIRIQFKDNYNCLFKKDETERNELVLRLQPNESVYMKTNIKYPGYGFVVTPAELDLTYKSRYDNTHLPDAYERLLIDVMYGNQVNFVNTDELHEAWRIFSPLLDKIEGEKVEPIPYKFGSRGPLAADDLLAKNGYKYTGSYKWSKS
ncbi:hypothetical protein SNEBB_008601 [Seison nebaliae]|nr:hypothetical protein SNEBB_008601 [Seison nebaliae]